MTHEELVEKVAAAIRDDLTMSIPLSDRLARVAIKITGEALDQSIRERMADVEYCEPVELTPACSISLRWVDRIFQSLTQGKET